MSCDQMQQIVTDLGWDRQQRRHIAQVLQHVDECPMCRAATADVDRLRSLLRVPDAEATPQGGWHAFEQRLLAAVSAQHAHRRRRPMRPWFVAAAAALLAALAGALTGRMLWPERPSIMAGNDAAVRGAWPAVAISPDEAIEHAQAFEQVTDFFNRKAAWMLVANGASDVGLAPQPITNGQLILLRLVMSHDKRIVSSADLVIVPGCSADLVIPLSEGTSLHYQIATRADDPGRLSLWAELQTPQGNEALAALATTLRLQAGQSTSAGRLVTAAGPYELTLAFSRAAMRGGAP